MVSIHWFAQFGQIYDYLRSFPVRFTFCVWFRDADTNRFEIENRIASLVWRRWRRTFTRAIESQIHLFKSFRNFQTKTFIIFFRCFGFAGVGWTADKFWCDSMLNVIKSIGTSIIIEVVVDEFIIIIIAQFFITQSGREKFFYHGEFIFYISRFSSHTCGADEPTHTHTTYEICVRKLWNYWNVKLSQETDRPGRHYDPLANYPRANFPHHKLLGWFWGIIVAQNIRVPNCELIAELVLRTKLAVLLKFVSNNIKFARPKSLRSCSFTWTFEGWF